ncbi:DNA recombination/repair protein RecA [Haemophilus influenzae]
MVILKPPQAVNALKFYSSVRLDIRRTGSVKDGRKYYWK